MDKISTMQGDLLVSQRLVLLLLLEESSPCLPLPRAEWDFLLNPHLQVVKLCRWKGSINARSKNSVYIQLIIFPVEFDIVQISRHMITACVQAFLTLVLAPDGCSRTVDFETTTSSKLPENFLGNLMSFRERDLLQSESLNLVQSLETTQYSRCRLRKSSCINVDLKCINW